MQVFLGSRDLSVGEMKDHESRERKKSSFPFAIVHVDMNTASLFLEQYLPFLSAWLHVEREHC